MLKPRSRRRLAAKLATSSNTATHNLDNEGKELKKLPKESNKGEKVGEVSEEQRQPAPSQAYK
jgi:hypothetical protein